MTSPSSKRRAGLSVRAALAVTGALLLLAGLIGAGCATTDEGDLPWNTPPSWQGVPGIPGLSD